MIKNYTELSKLKTFYERFEYLKLYGKVGEDTFGIERYLNQKFYRSSEWKRVRNWVIVRDNGCDLGIEGLDIPSHPIIHHINPLTLDDITNRTDLLLNPEYLITVCHATHNAIHFGDEKMIKDEIIERKPNDTIPWRKSK